METYKVICRNKELEGNEIYTFKANSFIHAMNYAYELYGEKIMCVYIPRCANRVEMSNFPLPDKAK